MRIKLNLRHYLVVGLVFWGCIAMLFTDFSMILPLSLLIGLIFFPKTHIQKQDEFEIGKNKLILYIIVICVVYLIDALFLRQKWKYNMLITNSAKAVEFFVDASNISLGKGRGFWDLFMNTFLIAPFVLVDFVKKRDTLFKVVGYCLFTLILIYETGISRGFLFTGILALVLSRKPKIKHIFFMMLPFYFLFTIVSELRDKGQASYMTNEFFDAFLFPGLNLNLLVNNIAKYSSSFDYFLEIIKKIIPSFIYPKEIFSFNIELTQVIYPHMGDEVSSISVFTYVSELIYFKPAIITAAIAGIVFRFLTYHLMKLFRVLNLQVTESYLGIMSITLLRSRTLDVVSLYLFAIIFLIFIKKSVIK